MQIGFAVLPGLLHWAICHRMNKLHMVKANHIPRIITLQMVHMTLSSGDKWSIMNQVHLSNLINCFLIHFIVDKYCQKSMKEFFDTPSIISDWALEAKITLNPFIPCMSNTTTNRISCVSINFTTSWQFVDQCRPNLHGSVGQKFLNLNTYFPYGWSFISCLCRE